MKFSDDVAAGLSPRLMLFMPPRHGKSFICSERFPTWHLGRHPDHQIIATSYGSSLAETFSKRALGLFETDFYKETFPGVELTKSSVSHWFVQKYKIRDGQKVPVGNEGGYRPAGVGGGIGGLGANLLIVDDPIKDQKDADSETMRENVWDWYTSTAYSRLMPGGGVIVITTRWHWDDLAGRLLSEAKKGEGDQWEVVSYPAIATKKEPFREIGEALHPERYPIDRLLAIKKVQQFKFEALYQQTPTQREGTIFKVERIQVIDHCPAKRMRTCRYWDKAGTEGGGAYTAGVKMSVLENGSVLIEHAVRGQWSAFNREKTLKDIATTDGRGVIILVEQEPGSGGKESAESTVKNLVGWVVRLDRPSGDKAARADPLSSQIEAGNVYMLRGDWNHDYKEEMRHFPKGKYKDQVDASSGAFNYLTAGRKYADLNQL